MDLNEIYNNISKRIENMDEIDILNLNKALKNANEKPNELDYISDNLLDVHQNVFHNTSNYYSKIDIKLEDNRYNSTSELYKVRLKNRFNNYEENIVEVNNIIEVSA